MGVRLVQPQTVRLLYRNGNGQSRFCREVSRRPAGARACQIAEQTLLQRAVTTRRPHCHTCRAGVTSMAVPVLADDQHVATLLAGKVFLRRPTDRDFDRLALLLGRPGPNGAGARLRKAYRAIPVVSRDRWDGIRRLVEVMAGQMGREARREMVGTQRDEPAGIRQAREYVLQHIGRPLRTREVASHCQLSLGYFCRLFKQTTGMTFVEYLGRARVERASEVLRGQSGPVTEMAFTCGFGSVQQFNATFRRYAGVSPTEYRARSGRQKTSAA